MLLTIRQHALQSRRDEAAKAVALLLLLGAAAPALAAPTKQGDLPVAATVLDLDVLVHGTITITRVYQNGGTAWAGGTPWSNTAYSLKLALVFVEPGAAYVG